MQSAFWHVAANGMKGALLEWQLPETELGHGSESSTYAAEHVGSELFDTEAAKNSHGRIKQAAKEACGLPVIASSPLARATASAETASGAGGQLRHGAFSLARAKAARGKCSLPASV